MMPLSMAKTGETVTIRKITGKDEVRQHLAELGFVVDAAVTVVNEIAGNLILQVKDSRVALDRGEAARRRPGEAPDHGHGHHQGRGDFRAEGGSSRGPHGIECAGV